MAILRVAIKKIDFKAPGEIWSPFISVGTSRQLGNMCSTSDGHAIVSYVLSGICYVAFANSIPAVLNGTGPFGVGIVIKTGLLGFHDQPAQATINLIDNKLHMVIYYYDSVADTFKAEFWMDSTGLGNSFVFVTFISEFLMLNGKTDTTDSTSISYIIKLSNGNLMMYLPYITDYYGTAISWFTMNPYYSNNGGLSWTLGVPVSDNYFITYWGGGLLELSDGSIITCKHLKIVAWSNSGTTYLGTYSWADFPDVSHMFAPGIIKTLTGEIFLYLYNAIFRYTGPIMETAETLRHGYNWMNISNVSNSSSITFRGLLCDSLIVVQDTQALTHMDKYAGSSLSTWRAKRIRRARVIADVTTGYQDVPWDDTAPPSAFRPSTIYDGYLSVVEKTNGKILCVISTFTGSFMEGECESVDILTSQNNSVPVWTPIAIDRVGTSYCSVSRVGSKLYLNITDTGTVNITPATSTLYISPSGDGGDWEYYSTIQSYMRTTTNAAQSLNKNGAGCITVLANGRWVLTSALFISYSGYYDMQYWVYISDNLGLTWTPRYNLRAYMGYGTYYEQGIPKHVAVTTSGALCIAFCANEGTDLYKFIRSVDNGDTWTYTAAVDTHNLWTGTYSTDFELISNGNNGLYLYANGYNGSNPTAILEIKDPLTNPYGIVKIATITIGSVSGSSNPSMSMIGGRLIITKRNYVIGVRAAYYSKIRNIKTMSAVDNWKGATL